MFTLRVLQLFTVGDLALVFHRVPEIYQLQNLFRLQFQGGNQFGNSSPDPRGTVGDDQHR